MLISLIAFGEGYTQNCTGDCIPLPVSKRLHEDAARKPYLDSMVRAREETIIDLELQIFILENDYEKLLKNADNMAVEYVGQLATYEKEIASLKSELRQQRRKLTWLKVKVWGVAAVAVVTTVVIAIVSKD